MVQGSRRSSSAARQRLVLDPPFVRATADQLTATGNAFDERHVGPLLLKFGVVAMLATDADQIDMVQGIACDDQVGRTGMNVPSCRHFAAILQRNIAQVQRDCAIRVAHAAVGFAVVNAKIGLFTNSY